MKTFVLTLPTWEEASEQKWGDSLQCGTSATCWSEEELLVFRVILGAFMEILDRYPHAGAGTCVASALHVL